LKITLGLFLIFSKILGDIRKSRYTTGINLTGVNLPSVSTTPAVNFATSSAGVVGTDDKFATGVNDTGGQLVTGVNDTVGNC
jgi:hypothetical protein